jgi:hypothetical protein
MSADQDCSCEARVARTGWRVKKGGNEYCGGN